MAVVLLDARRAGDRLWAVGVGNLGRIVLSFRSDSCSWMVSVAIAMMDRPDSLSLEMSPFGFLFLKTVCHSGGTREVRDRRVSGLTFVARDRHHM